MPKLGFSDGLGGLSVNPDFCPLIFEKETSCKIQAFIEPGISAERSPSFIFIYFWAQYPLVFFFLMRTLFYAVFCPVFPSYFSISC